MKRPGGNRMRGVKTAWSMIRQTFSEWSNDKAGRLGAALSYYTVFSLAPLLLIVISIAGLAFGRAAAEGSIFNQLSGLIGPDAARLIQAAVAKAHHTGGGILGTAIGIVILLVGATGVVTELQDALDTVWKVQPKSSGGVRGLVRNKLLSVAMILALGFLLLVSLVVSAVLSALSGWLRAVIGDIAILSWLIDAVVALGVISTLMALIYKILPDAKVAWRDVWVGALATAVLFLFGKYLIGLYIGRASVGSAFGAAGSLAALLVWIYYSAQIVLLGAEFTRVYANRFGAKVLPSEQAIPAQQSSVERPPPRPDARPQEA
jgi:membrane protein